MSKEQVNNYKSSINRFNKANKDVYVEESIAEMARQERNLIESQINSLQNELNATRYKISQLQSINSNVQNEVNSLQSQVSNLKLGEMNVKNLINSTNEKNKKITDEIKALVIEESKYASELESLKPLLTILQKDLIVANENKDIAMNELKDIALKQSELEQKKATK